MSTFIRDNMVRVLTSLIDGALSREAASEWATKIIDDDSLGEISKECWDVLVNIGAVDLIAPDREYLYETDDFKDWLTLLLRR